MKALTRRFAPGDVVAGLAFVVFVAGVVQWATLSAGAAPSRLWILAGWSMAALATAVGLAWQWRSLRPALLVLAVTLVVGLTRASGSHTAFTHFAGASLGLLWMVLVGRTATTPARLTLASALFLGAGAVALAVGIAGVPAFFPPELYSLIPGDLAVLRRALVSAERAEVNQNALAALVLLVTPVAACATVAVPRSLPHRLLLNGLGGLVLVAGCWILIVARSRTAMLGVWLLALVLLVRGLSDLRARLAAGTVAALLPAASVLWIWVTPREGAAEAVLRLHYSVHDRGQILALGWQRFIEHPWLGIGLNEFRHSYSAPGGSQSTVAHAHNVFLQTGLDLGAFGLIAYCWILAVLLACAHRTAGRAGALPRCAAAGGACSLLAVHFFGLTDAVALGAKIGLFQWMAAGLILASGSIAVRAEATASTPWAPVATPAELERSPL